MRFLTRRPIWISLCLINLCALLYIWGRPKSEISSLEDRGKGVAGESNENDKVARTEAFNATKICKLCIVMGIPSIKRPGGIVYLDKTLEYVVRKRGNFDNVVFVVYLAENDEEWRKEMTELVKNKFGNEVDRGLIQIIHPPDNLYPDWDKEMKITLGDPRHQVQWRSKQNIDQAYLMEYAYTLKPKYYLGIEDDVSAIDDYLLTMFQHAESASKDRDDILFLSYCKSGAIGKLFPVKILPIVSNYLKILWNYKPLDWHYWDLKRTLACRYPPTDCEKDANAIVVEYEGQLFEHMGKVSSLDRSIKS